MPTASNGTGRGKRQEGEVPLCRILASSWLALVAIWEPETVNLVNHVNLDSRKFPPCALEDDNAHGCTTESYMENYRDIASQGAQGSQNGDQNAQTENSADDGLDWSNGVAF